uniref:Uncharacterized protein n=1 Tax=Latimeria chalumnae TaxID=7897 RepID=H3AL48_LATCH
TLSANTVVRRTEDIGHNVFGQLLSDICASEWFTLAVDESTDISDVSQLSLYILYVKDFELREEFFSLLQLPERTTGVDVKSAINKFFTKWNIPKDKLVSLTTDSAKATTGSVTGLVGLLQKDPCYKNLKTCIHCLIHQQALCSKHRNMENVMSFVVKTVNVIKKSSALTHFKALLCQQGKDKSPLESTEWLIDTHFLTDLTHVNQLNLQLQGQNQLITDLISAVNSFKAKLKIFVRDITARKHFVFLSKQLASALTAESIALSAFKPDKYIRILEDMILEFNLHFGELATLSPIAELLCNPFKADSEPFSNQFGSKLASFLSIDDVEGNTDMEVCELQNSMELKECFDSYRKFIEFWKLVPRKQYKAGSCYNKIMWGSSYVCEQMFSVIKIIKSKLCSSISDSHPEDSLQISTASYTPQYSLIVLAIQNQKSH